MKQELWLSRDKTDDGSYEIHEGEPGMGYYDHYPSGVTDELCPKLFHQIVEGARLRKGRKRKIKRIVIELED